LDFRLALSRAEPARLGRKDFDDLKIEDDLGQLVVGRFEDAVAIVLGWSNPSAISIKRS
jgi:hypothetical protein